jgi:hypothetical protein
MTEELPEEEITRLVGRFIKAILWDWSVHLLYEKLMHLLQPKPAPSEAQQPKQQAAQQPASVPPPQASGPPSPSNDPVMQVLEAIDSILGGNAEEVVIVIRLRRQKPAAEAMA